MEDRGRLADGFARQILATTAPWLPRPVAELDVLDVGSGYGATAAALAAQVGSVVGLEPMPALHEAASRLATGNLSFRLGGVESLADVEAFDLVVLDNVYEHLPDHADALAAISVALRPGGVLFLLTPNRLWPIEAHYRLPFLSWLPLGLANRYLRASGRGSDYTDASYAPTAWGLRRELRRWPGLTARFVLPADLSATAAGAAWHYRAGVAALRLCPPLWAVSKSLLVVAVKGTPRFDMRLARKVRRR